MTAKILDGAALAKSIRIDLAKKVKEWIANENKRPGLAVVLVGEDPASQVYVKGKERDCNEVGFHSVVEKITNEISQKELEEVVRGFNQNNDIHGLLVQTPLPNHIDENLSLIHI